MFDKLVRRIVRTGKTNRCLKLITLLVLLSLFCRVSLEDFAATQSVRIRRAGRWLKAAFRQWLNAYMEQAAERERLRKKRAFRPAHRPAARAAAVALSVCMVFTSVPTTAFAAEAETKTGLCEHHTVHTIECGYQEAKPGHPCEHTHTAGCYTGDYICGYTEGGDAAASNSDAQHVHTQDCRAFDCPHENGEHEEDCGHTDTVEGTLCGYVCELCERPIDSGNSGNEIETITLVAFNGLDEAVGHQSVPTGTPLEELVLPEILSATEQTGEDELKPVVIQGVTWEPDVLYEGATGSYVFTASAAGYTCVQNVDWPVIVITVEETTPVPDEIAALCAAIDDLPTVDELYENAPGDTDPEFTIWVTEISGMLEEVPALWERLLALTEDTEAMERITDARAEKLAALNNLTERLTEMQLMAAKPAWAVGGEGTQDAPYQVATYEALKKFADNVSGSGEYDGSANTFENTYIKLSDAFPTGGTASELTTPIGGDRKPFKGHFDGSGRTVKLNIDTGNAGYTGLFGTVGKNGVVENVTVTGTVTSSGANSGGVAALNSGTVKNCSNAAAIINTSWNSNCGGVVGNNEGTVEFCRNTGTISGSDATGGVVGYNYKGKVQFSFNTEKVTGTRFTGGVVGFNGDGTVEHCYNTGSVEATLDEAGGVVGNNIADSASATVKNCYNTGTVTGRNYVGGVVGWNTYDSHPDQTSVALVENCVSLGLTVIGKDASNTDVGRIVWRNSSDNSPLKNNKARADMKVYENNTVVVTITSAADGIHGADLAVNNTVALSDVFSSSGGWVDSVWTVPSGKLTYGCALPTLVSVTQTSAPTLPGEASAIPTPTVDGQALYANGAPLLFEAGNENEDYTVIYIDKDGSGTVTNVDEIFDPDGEGEMVNTEAGNDLSSWLIFGGGLNQDVTSTQITMTGGKIREIYGGGQGLASGGSANVTGNTSVKISGGVVSSIIYAGGGAYENASANVTGNTKLEIIGGEIGDWVHGGGLAAGGNSSATVGGSSTVAISGTAVIKGRVFGGGYANYFYRNSNNSNVTGAATVTISGNAEVRGSVCPSGHLYDVSSIYAVNSDARGNSATVGEGSSITISGGVKIGGNTKGIFINGGSPTEVNTGVESFVIGDDLTEYASVNVQLPAGYDITSNPTIATGAVQSDLAKIKLVGPGAEGKEAYLEGSDIKVREKPAKPAWAASGDGTQDAPYQVATYEALKKFADNVSGSGEYNGNANTFENTYIKLSDAFPTGGTASEFTTPIGGDGKPFKGHFDGSGRTVKLNINTGNAGFAGLFGAVGENGVVENVTVTGKVTSSGANCGGVVGSNDGTVEFCRNTGTITGDESTGGVVGNNDKGKVQSCFNTEAVAGTRYTGGVVGINADGAVEHCYNTGSVKATRDEAGGVVGENGATSASATVKHCYNTGTVTGTKNVGGVVGLNISYSQFSQTSVTRVENCVSLGLTVIGTDASNADVGRIVGGNSTSRSYLANNKARADMKVYKNNEDEITITSAADGIHGADLAVDDTVALSDVFSSSGGWVDSVWTVPSGKLTYHCALPILKGNGQDSNPTLPREAPAIPTPTVVGEALYANGAPLLLKAGSENEDYTVIYIDKDGSGTVTNGDKIFDPDGTGTAMNDTEEGNDLKDYTIYGGGKGNDYIGDTSLTVLGGRVKTLYGGGEGIAGNDGTIGGMVTGNTSIVIKGGQITYAYGGGNLSEGTNVDGNTSVVIHGGTVGGVYGGGYGNGSITGDCDVTVNGGSVKLNNMMNMLCGGGYGKVEGMTSVKINGGRIDAVVFGGGREGGSVESSRVIVTGGRIAGALYGGGFAADTTGQTFVSMTGGELVKRGNNPATNGCIYGGSFYNAAGSQSVTLGGDAQVEGGVVFNGGDVKNGFLSVTIESALNGANPIPFILPEGFDASQKPVIATGAVETALAQIELTGLGAAELEAYRDGTDIRVHKPYTVTVSVKENGPYDKDEEIFLMADVRSTIDETEMTTGTVQFYKGEDALGQPVSYNLAGGVEEQTGFALAVICGSSASLPELTPGEDNTIKAVYTPVSGPQVSSKPITVSVKINGNQYISSRTVENQTGDGVNYVAPVQFGVANNGGDVGIKASQFVISGTKGGQPFTDFLVEATDDTATVKVKDPGTYVFTAKFPESSVYAGEEVSDSVIVLAPFTVTYRLEYLTAEGQPDQVNYGKPLSAVLSPVNGYKLPDVIQVYMGGSQLLPYVNYDYDSSTGVVEIAHVTGDVVISTKGFKKSADATLSALNYTVGNGQETAVPNFTSGTENYHVVLPYDTARNAVITLAGTQNNRYAVVTENNGVTLADGSGIAAVKVTAEDGTTMKTYTVNFTTAPGTDAGSSDEDKGSGSGSGSTTGTVSQTPSTSTSTAATEDGGSVTTTTTTTTDSNGKKTTVITEVKKDAAGNVLGSASAVTTDNVTTYSDQDNAGVMVYPDASAINNAAKAAGASAQSPADISVAVPQEAVNNQMQNPDVNSVQVNVVLPNSVKDNSEVQTIGVTVEKETVETVRQSGKRLEVAVREENGNVKAVWSLDGQTMSSEAGEATDLNLGLRAAPVQSADPIAAPVKSPVAAGGHENGLVLSIEMDGTLLSPAKLTVPATNQTGIAAGTSVAVYQFDPNTGALNPVPGGVYSVDANGNVTIDIPAGTRAGANETYVLLPVPAAQQAAAGAEGAAAYTIKAGDTLYQISKQYGCTVEELLALNPGVDIYNLRIGSNLRIR